MTDFHIFLYFADRKINGRKRYAQINTAPIVENNNYKPFVTLFIEIINVYRTARPYPVSSPGISGLIWSPRLVVFHCTRPRRFCDYYVRDGRVHWNTLIRGDADRHRQPPMTWVECRHRALNEAAGLSHAHTFQCIVRTQRWDMKLLRRGKKVVSKIYEIRMTNLRVLKKEKKRRIISNLPRMELFGIITLLDIMTEKIYMYF